MSEFKVTIQELSDAQMDALADRIEVAVNAEIAALERRLLAALRPPVPALPDLDDDPDDLV